MYSNHSLSENKLCLGLYCGKINQNGTCGPCQTGYTANHVSICTKCHDRFLMYDWLFLGFLIIQPVIFNMYFLIKLSVKLKSTKLLWILQLSVILESMIASVISLILFEPTGSLYMIKCSTTRLSDWYTMFYNPSPDFINTIYCTHEAVYPLKTIVIVFYSISTILSILNRPLIILYIIKDKLWIKSLYYALYTYPILIIFYFAFSGLLYYSFGYIILVAAILASACLFSTSLLQSLNNNKLNINSNNNISIAAVLKITIIKSQNLLIVGCTWFALFYSIVSVTELKHPTYYGLLFAAIPFPYLFFCFTLHFTNPSMELYSVI